MVLPAAYDRFAEPEAFTIARLIIRGMQNRENAFSPDLVTRLDIMYSVEFDPFVWSPLLNTNFPTAETAAITFWSRGLNGGMSAAESEWFQYPAAMVNRIDRPLWLGLKISDDTPQVPGGFRIRSIKMEVR